MQFPCPVSQCDHVLPFSHPPADTSDWHRRRYALSTPHFSRCETAKIRNGTHRRPCPPAAQSALRKSLIPRAPLSAAISAGSIHCLVIARMKNCLYMCVGGAMGLHIGRIKCPPTRALMHRPPHRSRNSPRQLGHLPSVVKCPSSRSLTIQPPDSADTGR